MDGTSWKFGQTKIHYLVLSVPIGSVAQPQGRCCRTRPNLSNHPEQCQLRWKIECMLKHLKTNGYPLEDLNLRDEGKTRLMMALVATPYLLSVKEGWHRRKKIPLKKYADGSQCPAVSIFREGLGLSIEKCEKLVRFLGISMLSSGEGECPFVKMSSSMLPRSEFEELKNIAIIKDGMGEDHS